VADKRHLGRCRILTRLDISSLQSLTGIVDCV
jgi:hypothetical protein